MRLKSLMLALLIVPAPSVAQLPSAELQERVEALLDEPEVAALLQSLSGDLITHFVMLVPELPSEDQSILAEAVAEAFDPSVIRTDIARAIAAEASSADIDQLTRTRASGSAAQLNQLVDDYEPTQSFQEFGADVAGIDRERLQLMASLTEARRSSELDLLVEEVLRRVAHDLVNELGGELGAFTPLEDGAFDAAYRDRTLTHALRSMHRMQPASDELIGQVIEEFGAPAAQRYTEQYVAAVVQAVGTAGHRLAALTAPAEETPAPEPLDPGAAPPCRVLVCGFQVDWDGPEPSGNTTAYRAPGDLERFTFENLINGGYVLARGPVEEGLTIRLRPRATRARCEIISGTNNRGCLAVGQVRVEFVGSYPGRELPPAFLVRNRCRANEFMAAPGISALVAARIHHALTTFPGDERSVPGC